MDRAQLKNMAKAQIKNNIWMLFLISLIISAVSGLVNLIPLVGQVASILAAATFSLAVIKIYLKMSNGIKPEVLCLSRAGREVPLIRLGNGERKKFLTSRHHACESTGTYVLMGFIKEYLKSPIENTSLVVVPMVDYDGVVCGDQGKNRAPYDHNRDYTDSPIYPETAAIMSLAKRENAFFAIDFHSPWHLGKQNDYVFIVRKYDEKKPLFDRFGALLEKYCAEDGMKYFVRDDMMPNTSWNIDSTPTAATFFSSLPSCHLAFSLETTYFGTEDNKVSAEKLDTEGRAVCRALGEYLSAL